ncbi:hypothetical protein ACP4OV_021937 [Aristida adscensionis]
MEDLSGVVKKKRTRWTNIVDAHLDLDTLDCPVCCNPFLASIFQCKNGHAACESCCVAVRNVCPFCREPIGDIRCRPLEKAIAGVVFPCAYATHGCTQRLKYADKQAHEESLCQHVPCSCPIAGCGYIGAALHRHVRSAHLAGGGDELISFYWNAQVTLHRDTPFRVLLHTIYKRAFLLLNGGDVPSGRSLSVVCVGPRPAADGALEYKMEVAGGEPEGALSLSASGPVSFTRRCSAQPPAAAFLFVPDAYWTSSGNVSVTVHVDGGWFLFCGYDA